MYLWPVVAVFLLGNTPWMAHAGFVGGGKHPFPPNRRTTRQQALVPVLRESTPATEQTSSVVDWNQPRLPTSVDDQIRQAVQAIHRATADGIRRHSLTCLLPLLDPSELDDWPGGARQMMQAADPIVQEILKQTTPSNTTTTPVDRTTLDASDGLYALLAQGDSPQDDACAVLLPSADNVQILQQVSDRQVGPKRNMFVVNPQWKRQNDFGSSGIFGMGNAARQDKLTFVEGFMPTFSCTNLMVEGDQVRILRSHPGPWRVFLLGTKITDGEDLAEWTEIGSFDFVPSKPGDWDERSENSRDGGRLFDFGKPTYQEIASLIQSSPDYKPKSYAERASAAFTFIKDTL